MLEKGDVLILDGACGTNLQEMVIPPAAWQGCEGCNELLNVTAPEVIVELHRFFVDAGAHLLETNTFGAKRVVLDEYGLGDRVAEINSAAVANARKAFGAGATGLVAGSVGPTTKLVSLGHIDREQLMNNYVEQIRALLHANVDAIIIETCQDLLQIKTALVACRDVFDELGCDLPILVSITIESTGTMLVGTDIGAVCATVEPFSVFSLGLNCATGPADMEQHIRYLSEQWPTRISCVPNQGLPEVKDGKTVYRLGPKEFAAQMKQFVTEWGVQVVGGCCGTTPAHIRALVKALDGVRPAEREVTT